jgi:hypothetical protein
MIQHETVSLPPCECHQCNQARYAGSLLWQQLGPHAIQNPPGCECHACTQARERDQFYRKATAPE